MTPQEQSFTDTYYSLELGGEIFHFDDHIGTDLWSSKTEICHENQMNEVEISKDKFQSFKLKWALLKDSCVEMTET